MQVRPADEGVHVVARPLDAGLVDGVVLAVQFLHRGAQADLPSVNLLEQIPVLAMEV